MIESFAALDVAWPQIADQHVHVLQQ